MPRFTHITPSIYVITCDEESEAKVAAWMLGEIIEALGRSHRIVVRRKPAYYRETEFGSSRVWWTANARFQIAPGEPGVVSVEKEGG